MGSSPTGATLQTWLFTYALGSGVRCPAFLFLRLANSCRQGQVSAYMALVLCNGCGEATDMLHSTTTAPVLLQDDVIGPV